MNLRGPRYAPFTAAEEVVAFETLITSVGKARDRAKTAIVEHHLRLVVKLAHSSSSSLPIDDRISEGTLGLMRAIDSYDHTRGARFAGYARPAIQQAIDLASRAHAVIPVPRHATTPGPTTTSLDAPMGPEGGWTMHDVLSSPPEGAVERQVALGQLLDRLPPEQSKVLRSALSGQPTNHAEVMAAYVAARKILRGGT